jgi:hypothetical protein
MLISFRLARDSVYPTLVDALFTQVPRARLCPFGEEEEVGYDHRQSATER